MNRWSHLSEGELCDPLKGRDVDYKDYLYPCLFVGFALLNLDIPFLVIAHNFFKGQI